MPTKKRTTTATKKKAATKKPVAKKKAPAKKKPAAKKPVAKKKAPAKKKPAAKKPVAKKKAPAKKKPAAKKVVKKPVAQVAEVKPAAAKKIVAEARSEAKAAIDQAPIVTITETQVKRPNKVVEVEKRIVFVGTCANCDHLPMRVNELLGVVVVIVAILAGMLISTTALGGTGTQSVVLDGIGEIARSIGLL
jgi:hypothetical protein